MPHALFSFEEMNFQTSPQLHPGAMHQVPKVRCREIQCFADLLAAEAVDLSFCSLLIALLLIKDASAGCFVACLFGSCNYFLR